MNDSSKLALSIIVLSVFIGIGLSELTFYTHEKGLLEVNEIEVEGNTLIIGKECTVLPMGINDQQAASIKLALDNKSSLRPLTHDIFSETLENFNIKVERVVIHSLKNNSYRANIYFKKEGNRIKVDSRPSDGVALALRTGSRIYVKEDLLDAHGVNICSREGKGFVV